LRRRQFLIGSALLGAGLLLPESGFCQSSRQASVRQVALHNLHTGERLRAEYLVDGELQRGVLQALDHLLRDHRSGEIHAIDPRLFDQLFFLQTEVGCSDHLEIISGYRSPQSNAKLRQKSAGVAKNSLHMSGRAIDFRIPGCDLGNLRTAALSLRAGGVGYYPRENFVHIDTGRIRHW